MERLYYCIGLTALFASAECVERGLDPDAAALVVADPRKSGGAICFSVSPALLKRGVGARCRLCELPEDVGVLRAPPRVPLYVDYAARVYGALLSLFSKDDLYAYAMNEFFVDATDYLALYGADEVALGVKILNTVREKTGLAGRVGIGENLFLARTALDLPARYAPAGVALLDRQTFLQTLSDHAPLSDFREFEPRTVRMLDRLGIHTMRQIREAPAETLRSAFGVRAAMIADHANGIETVSLRDVKRVKARSTAMRESVDLQRDYAAGEGAEVIAALMARLSARLKRYDLGTNSVSVYLIYGPEEDPAERGSGTSTVYAVTNDEKALADAALAAYRRIVNPELPLRKIAVYCNHVAAMPKDRAGGGKA